MSLVLAHAQDGWVRRLRENILSNVLTGRRVVENFIHDKRDVRWICQASFVVVEHLRYQWAIWELD